MTTKISLRKLDWSDIIIYFLNLKEQDLWTSKDLVNYFHFNYLTGATINRWTTPDYIRQIPCAKKLLSLYGKDFSIKLIDILYNSYSSIFNKRFYDIHWSIGLLSSEKTGWIIEKIMRIYKDQESLDVKIYIDRLLKKERKDWTIEETKRFNELMQSREK